MVTSTTHDWSLNKHHEDIDISDNTSLCEAQTHTLRRLASMGSPRLRHTTSFRNDTEPRLCMNGLRDKFTPYPPSLSETGLASVRHKGSPPNTATFLPALWRYAESKRSFWNSRAFWLILYFSFNLTLTLSNKSVLTGFPFPYTLTSLHALCSTIGGLFLRWYGAYTPRHLSRRDEIALAAFSFLYGINVAVSNVSLHIVTVPFHQVVRAITPVFTMSLSALLFNAHFNRAKLISLAPVVLGVVFATYGDYYFTFFGFLLTLFGTILAALKTIFTSVLQSSPKSPHASASSTATIPTPASWRRQVSPDRSKSLRFSRPAFVRLLRCFVPPRLDIHPLDLLTRMSPLAFVQCVIYAQLSGELDALKYFGLHYTHALDTVDMSSFMSNMAEPTNSTSAFGCPQANEIRIIGGIPLMQALVLLLNGGLAFGLNVVSFSANGKVGPLSMTVAANVKQVLTILCAVSLFNLTITPMNALGISITLIGGAWYAWAEYTAKVEKEAKRFGH